MLYNTLKSGVQQTIKNNGNREISGGILQDTLITIINALGNYYQFAGLANPQSSGIDMADQRLFLIASTPGTYPGYGNLTVAENEVALFFWDSAWHKQTVDVAKASDVVNNVEQLSWEAGLLRFMQSIDSSFLQFEQGAFAANGSEVGEQTRIRCVGALSPKGLFLGVPEGFVIHEVYYYNRWNSNADFDFVAPYITVGKRFYQFDSAYNYVRFSVRRVNNGRITPDDLVAGLPLISTAVYEKLAEMRRELLNLNAPTKVKVGYELTSSGAYLPSANWSASGDIVVAKSLQYTTNYTGNIYCYDQFGTMLGRVTGGTALIAGTVFVRLNWLTANGAPYFFSDDDSVAANAREVQFNSPLNLANANRDAFYKLPNNSSIVELEFSTTQSIYHFNGPYTFFILDRALEFFFSPGGTEDSYYCHKSTGAFRGGFSTNSMYRKGIPMALQNFGKDVFSLRLKYPVVQLAADGKSTMVTAVPTQFQNAYVRKTDTAFTIYNGDDTVFKTFTFSSYASFNAFVDALMADSAVAQYFEVIKYDTSGVAFSDILNFDKIYITKEIREIYYDQPGGAVSYTGNQYYDAYPTFIRTSDIGFRHKLKMAYRVSNGIMTRAVVSLDGMFMEFNETEIDGFNMENANIIFRNLDVFQLHNISVLPYSEPITPMISMQHAVIEGDEVIGQEMTTTTLRQYELLAELQKRGFVGQNFTEWLRNIKGARSSVSRTYCLTFDDNRKDIWTNENIRNIFNMFGACPTLVELTFMRDLLSGDYPETALTRADYDKMKASGWDMITHGFCLQTDMLSYQQFITGFSLIKRRWLEWFGIDVQSYNPHGAEIVDYQFYLLKHLGFSAISSGIALLGWFCEAGTTVDVEYKRVTWMDAEISWGTILENLERWIY